MHPDLAIIANHYLIPGAAVIAASLVTVLGWRAVEVVHYTRNLRRRRRRLVKAT